MLWYLIFIYEERLSICVDALFEFISTTHVTPTPFTGMGVKEKQGFRWGWAKDSVSVKCLANARNSMKKGSFGKRQEVK